MLVHLVRHAIAVERGTPGIADEQRPLTSKGVRRMKEAVRGLCALGVEIGEIWTSPLVRARQTADILAGLCGFNGRVEETELLAPGGDATALLERMSGLTNVAGLALVGHEPDIGELCGRILTGRPESLATFKKGAVAGIELVSVEPAPRGTLHWLMQPGALRKLAASCD